MTAKTLGAILSASAKHYPGKSAIIFGQKKITFQQLNETSNCIAAGIISLGIKPGDKVAIFLDNSPEFIESYYAILKSGAIAVPINYMFKTEEAKFILQDSQSSCIITSRAYLDTIEKIRLRLDTLKHIITTTKVKENLPNFHQFPRHSADDLNLPHSDSNNPAVIIYTSGTTGYPKGAVLTHHNLISNASDCLKAIQITKRDNFICVLPLFHAFAATVCMNLPILVGGKIVLMKSVRPFKRVIRAILKNRVSIFVGVPSIYNILKNFKLPGLLNTPLIKLFNPLRMCISGSAALPVETLKAFEKKFRIPLLEGYGLTEASPVVTINPLKSPRKPGSIGKRLSKDIFLKIIDEQGNLQPHGRIGELLVKSPGVMQGYYHQKEATNETISNGWLHTGDMAKIDNDGYVYIVGRKKEMINVRGLNVYPREIEEILYQNPKIKEAAVIGLPDAHKGEVPKGFIVLKDNSQASEQEILQYLRERLAGYKIPKHIEFRTELPKNATGKILKRLLENEKQ